MRITILLFIFSLIVAGVHCQTSTQDIKRGLALLEKSLKDKDTLSTDRYLDPVSSIGTRLWKKQIHIILKNTDFESVKLSEDKKPEREGDTTLANVRFYLRDGKVKESIVAFNADGKILYVDYFDRLFGHSRFRESKLIAALPFRQINNSIVLTIRLNDDTRPLLFLLDTGADGMAVRKSLADSLGLKVSRTQMTSVVGARMQVEISSGNTVRLSDSLFLENQNIALFETVTTFDGIIGLNLINNYRTEVNFDEKQISLYSFGKHTYKEKGITLPVKVSGSLLVLPSSLNLTGKNTLTGNFIMDTGADYHLILFSRFVRKNRLLLSGFKPEGQATTVSLGHSTPVFYGKAREFTLGNECVMNDMPVTLQASSGKSNDSDDIIDGSIGIRLFNQFNFTIDLLNRTIHFYPKKTVDS